MTPLALPDIPRWVEAHGIAGDAASWRVELGGGFAVGSDRAQLIVVAGDADVAAVCALATARHAILVVRDDLATALGARRAILHTQAEPDDVDTEHAIPLPPGTSLAHLPPALAAELAAVDRTIWSAWVDDRPVAFAYAPWRSTAWFDVSVDTLPEARQLGLATLVAAAMIRDERAHGRAPVWGADEANVASLRLARRLGFTPVDAVWIAPPGSKPSHHP